MAAKTADQVVVELRVDNLSLFEGQLRRAQSVFSVSMGAVERRSEEAGKNIASSLRKAVSTAAVTLGGAGLAFGARALTQYAEAWTDVRNKVVAAGVPLQQVPRIQEQIYQQAQKTWTSLETQADMFQRVSVAARELGRSRDEVSRFNEIVTKSMRIGGASTADAGVVATQLTQGLGTGLRGDDLRSLREKSPVLTEAIAKEFGTTVFGLGDLVAKGQVAPDRVFKAILDSGKEVDALFKSLTPTFDDFRTRVDNAFTRFVGLAATAAGTSREFQNAADGLVRTFEDPEVIQAAADALAEIVSAIKPMLGLVATLARNWELFVAAGAGLVALKLVELVQALASAVKFLTAAMMRNPITALLVGGAAVVAYIYEITDGFQNWSSEAKKAADEQNRLNAQIDQLQAMNPDVTAFFNAVMSGAANAADGLKTMSAEARQAAVDLANLELKKAQIADINLRGQQAEIERKTQAINDVGVVGLGGATLDPDAIRHIRAYAWNMNRLNFELAEGASAEEFASQQKVLNDELAKQPVYVRDAAKAYAELQGQRDQLSQKQKMFKAIIDEAQNLPPATTDDHSGGGGGGGGVGTGPQSGAATKEEQSNVDAFIQSLKDQVAQLGLSNTALKEAELLAQYESAAREDLNKKLQRSSELRAQDVEQIKETARQLTAVPAILGVARDQLPEYAEGQQRAQLQGLLASLSNPKVVEALKAQGLSVEDATKAINLQINSIDSGAKAATEAIAGIGNAFVSGIQGATDLNDAIVKIGMSLLNLLTQGLFGQGQLGGLFNQLFDAGQNGAGLLSYLFGGSGGSAADGVINAANAALAIVPKRAGGGQALPGQLYEVGETGREWFAPSVPGQVIPNHVIKAAAGGGGSGGPPINFNISLAGANGDRAIAEIAAAAVRKGLAQVPEINRQHRIRFA